MNKDKQDLTLKLKKAYKVGKKFLKIHDIKSSLVSHIFFVPSQKQNLTYPTNIRHVLNKERTGFELEPQSIYMSVGAQGNKSVLKTTQH